MKTLGILTHPAAFSLTLGNGLAGLVRGVEAGTPVQVWIGGRLVMAGIVGDAPT